MSSSKDTTNSSFTSPFGNGSPDFSILFQGSQPHPYEDHPTLRFLSEYMFLVLGVVGLVANVVVIAIVVATKRLKTNTYILILNACVADLFVLGFKTVPTFLEKRTESWEMGVVLCKLYGLSWTLSDCASILFMVAISAERFIVITKPLHASSILTKRNRVSTVVVIWAVSFLFASQELFHYELKTIFGMDQCTKLHVEYLPLFLLLEYLLFFLAPLATMGYLYGAVIRSIYHSISIRRAMVAAPSGCGANDANDTYKARLKIVFMMITVGILFTLTSLTAKWSILFCTHVLNIVPLNEIGHNVVAYFWLENIFIIRSFDSVANPFIYFALSANLREALCDVTKLCRPKQDSTSAATRGLSTANSRHFATQSVGVSNYEMQNLGQNGTKSSTTTIIDEKTGAERNKTSASHA